MKPNRRTILRRLTTATGVLVIFASGTYVGRQEWFSYGAFRQNVPESFVIAIKNVRRKLLVARQGDSAFIAEKLATQYAALNGGEIRTRVLETSALPITLEAFPLAGGGTYPAIAGGITAVEGKVVVLDRLGVIYKFENNVLQKIEQPELPSNLKRFVRASDETLNSETLRTHSIAYDKVRQELYVSYERFDADSNRFQHMISAAAFDKAAFRLTSQWRTVYEGERRKLLDGQAGAGKVLVVADTLFFSVGHLGPSESGQLQASSNSFGKIFQYNLVTHKLSARSSGHRNTQGLVYSIERELINTEHGPQGGDEINRILEGKNYGWPDKTYGTDYGRYSWPWSKNVGGEKSQEPLFAWVPSIGISSIIQVTSFHKKWYGDLIVGSLKAQSLYRLKYLEGRIVFVEPIWIGHRIRDLLQLDNHFYVLTDDALLITASVDEKLLAKNSKFEGFVNNPDLARCMVCHQFTETTPTSAAPSLRAVVGRKIAGDDNFRYSEGLRAKSGAWTDANLRAFLKAPSTFAPGTTMPNLSLSDGQIGTIIRKLRK